MYMAVLIGMFLVYIVSLKIVNNVLLYIFVENFLKFRIPCISAARHLTPLGIQQGFPEAPSANVGVTIPRRNNEKKSGETEAEAPSAGKSACHSCAVRKDTRA